MTFMKNLKAVNADKNILGKLLKMNEQMTAIQRILFQKKQARNPYNKLALFDNDAPEDATTVAGLMVAAFGYEYSSETAKKFADLEWDDEHTQAAQAWEMVDEIIGQMLHAENQKNKIVPIRTADEDDLAPESIEEAAEEIGAEAKGTQESFSLAIKLNEKQEAAKDLAFAGKSFCLIGPAGSGKTTAQRAVAASLYDSGALETTTFAFGGGSRVTAPSIAFVAFTRRAAGNLRKAIFKDPRLEEVFRNNIMTVHALLEYQPDYYWDSVEQKNKFRFAPLRTAKNPLTITHLVIEEASMIGMMDLYQKLYDALPPNVQIIFIGDINQLPPVFGPSVLNYALSQLPIVELTEVYRNQGMVLENAHNILNGRPLKETKECQIVRGNKPVQLGQEMMGNRIIPTMFKALFESKDENGIREYDPEHDMILAPWNKQAMGTTNINYWIAQHMGDMRKAIVYEIIAGFNKVYLAEGDPVMVNKQDAIITKIERNPRYMGKEPQLPGNDLSRFGTRILDRLGHIDLDEEGTGDTGMIDYSNFSLESLASEEAGRKQQCSHLVTVRYKDNGFEETLSSAGEFAEQVFSLGYCLTVHKAQGSEWRKVFLLMHKDHGVSLYREWFYTGYTRARIGVTVIAKDFVIEKAIKNQRIKGQTLKDKLAFFNSGIENLADMPVLPGASR